MMLEYTAPELKIELLKAKDIITTSGGASQGGGNSDTETPDDDLWG